MLNSLIISADTYGKKCLSENKRDCYLEFRERLYYEINSELGVKNFYPSKWQWWHN